MHGNSETPIWITDGGSCRFVVVNDAAVRLFGQEKELLLNMTIFDVASPDDAADVKHAHDGSRINWVGLLPDGRRFRFATVIHAMDGDVVNRISFASDVQGHPEFGQAEAQFALRAHAA